MEQIIKMQFERKIPIFSRASDEFCLRILNRMVKDPTKLYWVKDFQDLGKRGKIMMAMKRLEKMGKVEALKGYPRYYRVHRSLSLNINGQDWR